jgi:amino acid transporter
LQADSSARGVKPGAHVQNLLSILKIAMIIGLAVVALLLAPRASAVAPDAAAPSGLRLAAALIPCFYAYGGYQLTINLGADLQNARRRFPLAITGGMFTVVGLYLLLNFAYQRVLGIDGIAVSKLVPAFLLGSFDKVVHYVIFTDTLCLAAVASTLFVLRRRHTGDAGFSMLGYPVLPAFYIVCLLGVGARVVSLEPRLALASVAVLLTGWPLFQLGHKLFGGSAAGV